MNTLDGFDWSTVSASLKNIEQDNLENPDASVVEAVLNKDVALLQRALEAGGNAKQTVGKEKMSVFAILHFHEDVCNALSKAGVSFKDVKVFTPAFQNDDAAAIQWLMAQKCFKSLDPKSVRLLLVQAMELAGWECFKWIHKQHPEVPLAGNSGSPSVVPQNNYYIMNTLQAFLKSRPLSSLVEALKYPKLFDKKSVREGLFGTHAFQTMGQMSLTEIQKFQQLHQLLTKEWNDLHLLSEFKAHASFYGSDIRVQLLGLGEDVFSKGSNLSWVRLNNPPLARSITDAVILSGNALVKNLCQSEEGQKALSESLNSPQRLALFAQNASKDTLAYVFKNHKGLHEFRDSNNNNIFHYALFLNSMSASFFQDMYTANKELLFEVNGSGYAPLHDAPPNLVSKIEKSMLSRAVKGATKGKSFAPVTKRRM